jgi:Zn-finger nucleic acid-binding protein
MARTKRTMRLDCPRDRTPLVEQEHEIPGRNVWADHCPKCEGIFLDKDELAKLTGARNINQLITEYLGVDVGSELVCPACGGLMDDEHFVGATSKVTIDVCTTCQGVWLDQGELEAIAKLDDKSFDKLSAEKRAEVFDQDLARKRGMRGSNVLTQAFANFAHGLKMGTRKFR